MEMSGTIGSSGCGMFQRLLRVLRSVIESTAWPPASDIWLRDLGL
jgi:hypothetical protein